MHGIVTTGSKPPADMRSNAIIDAANMICEAYAMSEDEYKTSKK